MIKSQITEEEKMILQEVAGMGVGHASVALERLTNAKIQVSVPEVDVITVDDAPKLFVNEEKIIGVTLKVVGGLNGCMVYLFKSDDVRIMCALLNNLETNDPDLTDDLEIATIKEVANILTGAYLGAITKFTNLYLLHAIPLLIRGSTKDVLRIVENDVGDPKLIIVKSKLGIGDHVFEFVGFLLLSIKEDALHLLLQTIKDKYSSYS